MDRDAGIAPPQAIQLVDHPRAELLQEDVFGLPVEEPREPHLSAPAIAENAPSHVEVKAREQMDHT